MKNELTKTNQEIVKLDSQEVFKQNTNPVLYKDVKNIPAAIEKECDTLVGVKKQYGEKLILAIVKVWLINFNDFINLSRKMNEIQINETAQMILDEFYNLKISDLALIFSRMKTGYYGSFYESIDGMKIMDIFYKYGQERINYFIDNHKKEKQEISRNNKALPISSIIKKQD